MFFERRDGQVLEIAEQLDNLLAQLLGGTGAMVIPQLPMTAVVVP